MRIILAVTIAALAAAATGCSTAPPPAPENVTPVSPTDEGRLDSIALIDRAVNTGLLDYSTGILYKVYVMFDSASVPPEYQSDVPAKCGTPLIMEVQRNWQRILPEHRSEIEIYIAPIGEIDDTDTELDDVTPDRLEHERNRLD